MYHTLDYYLRLLSVQLRSQMQYRFNFLWDIFATAMITALGIGSLAMIFGRFGGIAGWSLAEVAFLYGIVETSFGVMDMFFSGFDPALFGRMVRLGRFDQLLLRPVNIVIQVLGSEFATRRLGRIFQGALVFGIAVANLNVHWNAVKILYLPVVFLSTICFFGGLFMMGSGITFWTIESIELVNILTYGGSEMMSYPMHIYQNWLRRFFTYILPAIFLIYYPALYFLDKPDPLNMPVFAPFLSPLVGVGVLAGGLAFWRFGLRYYQSTGT